MLAVLGATPRGALPPKEHVWVEGPRPLVYLPSPWARNELSDHLDAMDSNLDNLQTMLTSHGFSVDTGALLDVSLTHSTHLALPGHQSALTSLPPSHSCSAPP